LRVEQGILIKDDISRTLYLTLVWNPDAEDIWLGLGYTSPEGLARISRSSRAVGSYDTRDVAVILI